MLNASPSSISSSSGPGNSLSSPLRQHSNSNNSATNKKKNKDQKTTLPERVAQAYYKHGLFLSSYPTCATSIAIVVVLLCCYPLVNIPLPGTIPTKIILPYTDSYNENIQPNNENDKMNLNNIFPLSNITFEPPFPWARSDPFIYVQQIILRSTVAPWNDSELLLTDAFRGPLHEIFNLLELIRNHECCDDDDARKISLGNICLHIENVKSSKEKLFPEYNCLMLSPANFWQQSIQNFNKDTTLLNTIFHHQNLQKSKVSTAEMLLGMKIRDSGLKRYPIRLRSRIIQYAVTIFLRENDKYYLESLKSKLITKYSLHQRPQQQLDEDNQQNHNVNKVHYPRTSIMYIYYPGEFNLMEFLPLFSAFVSLFVYVYFSLRKIDVIKSRLFLAISSVITVLGSLAMSLGLCFFFGLTISMQSKGIYPYLVIIVGLENVLVITKSVVSIDETLDLKIRLAKGLSREGWSITKNLMTEITILTIGLSTFVPVIQEFCVFAIVGLISDFFLQMIFFSTILALDIKKSQFSVEELKHLPKSSMTIGGGGFSGNGIVRTKNHIKSTTSNTVTTTTTINRSRSHPRLTALDYYQATLPTDILAGGCNVAGSPGSSDANKRLPKRVRLFNFWARTRFFQRAFMLWMLVWIVNIIYNSGLIEHLLVMGKNFTTNKTNESIPNSNINNKILNNSLNSLYNNEDDNKTGHMGTLNSKNNHNNNENDFKFYLDKNLSEMSNENLKNFTEYINKLKYSDYEPVFQLSNFHWSSILKQYNISMDGKYVTILPSIKLSHVIPPEIAIQLRNPMERTTQNFQWKAFAAALDPIDFHDLDYQEPSINGQGNTPLYPTSPMEIFLTFILCCISVFFLAYLMVVLYRCICSRNYAEWRASWNTKEEDMPKTQQVLTCVTLKIKGHHHTIDCVAIDNSLVASACLEGRIKIWDATNGELMADIVRSNNMSYDFKLKNPTPIWCLDYLDNLLVIGCADGRLEFWEGTTEKFKCVYKNESHHNDGVTHVKFSGDKVIAARLSGRVDILRLGTYNRGIPIDYNFSSVYRRTHMRAGSTGSLSSCFQPTSPNTAATTEELKCFLECQHEGHQQPITCLEVSDGIILTGSQDHTLKVFKLENSSLMYTLHGHFGPITCLFIDNWQRGTGGSGSEDGLLYIWDLIAGAGIYKIEAHNGPVISVVCSPSYIISLGSDGKLCVWERFQLNLMNTISVAHTYSTLLMVTSSLLVRAKPGALVVLDVRTGETAGEAELDDSNLHICPKILLASGDSVVCDYGNQLRIVRFPLITSDKCE